MGLNFARLVMGPALTAFGERRLYRPLVSAPGEPPFTVCGIWKSPTAANDLIDGQGVHDMQLSAQSPVLAVRAMDMPVTPAEGDEVVINGRTWRVWNVRPDGEGRIELDLRTD